MASELKKRRGKLGLIFGAVSGAIIAVALFLVTGEFNPIYLIFIPIAAAIGAGQLYMMTPE
jgi:hypothetical protein